MFLTSAPQALDITEDGYDIQWATNALGIYLIPWKEFPVVRCNLSDQLLGPFYFTKLLIPALMAGAKQSADGKARVTFAASIVQTKSINYDAMTDTPARKKMCADQRYGQSKFVCGPTLNVVFSEVN